MPCILSNRIFKVLDCNNNSYLNQKSFVDGIHTLFSQNFDKLLNFIFKIYDFDNDGYINCDDIRTVLSFIIITELKPFQSFINVDQIATKESLEELESILVDTFKGKSALNYNSFILAIENYRSETFLFILFFILKNKPFNENNLTLQSIKKNIKCFFKIYKKNKKDISLIALPNINSKILALLKINKIHEFLNIDINKQENVIQNAIFRINKKKQKLFDNFSNNLQDYFENQEVKFDYEGPLYKITRSNKLKQRFYKLTGKDWYYFTKKSNTVYHHIRNLSGVYLKEGITVNFNSSKYYSFSLFFANKCRVFYSDNFENYNNWIDSIYKATEQKNIYEKYNLEFIISESNKCVIYKGTHKESNIDVAIKSFDKLNMDIKHINLVKNEIEIVNFCHHPNIISIYDNFETYDQIFISN